MSVSIFITLLTLFSTVTALVVEAEKILLPEHNIRIASNTLALVTACIIGWIGTSVYYIFDNVLFTTQNTTALLLMGVACGLCSMVGYDKVMQTIEQIKR